MNSPRTSGPIDVAGVGLNATDTIIRLPHFPAPNSKTELISTEIKAGGQVASAIVACQRWGLKTRYAGKVVRAVDTTGAGDVFRGAFAYGLLQGWAAEEILEFSCAAALNCTAPGARGGIATLGVIEDLRRRGERSEITYVPSELREAALSAEPGYPR